MKNENQHLDYLISQYVDGTLDAGNKKSLEQRMVNDPDARAIYKEHRDVQDLLDDWGNRIPLIRWDDFDKKLAEKLEHVSVGGQRVSIFRRWGRPLSAAAALFVAAAVGYGWHAFSSGGVSPNQDNLAQQNVVPSVRVAVEQPGNPVEYRHREFRVEEQPQANQQVASDVTISAPGDVAATESLKDTVAYGLGSVGRSVQPSNVPSSVQAMRLDVPRKDDKDLLPPAYP